jgi:pilus assembly protein Flp/PilA
MLRNLNDRLASLRARAESGQGMVEYALILVLIAVVVIAVLTFVGSNVSNTFSQVNASL